LLPRIAPVNVEKSLHPSAEPVILWRASNCRLPSALAFAVQLPLEEIF